MLQNCVKWVSLCVFNCGIRFYAKIGEKTSVSSDKRRFCVCSSGNLRRLAVLFVEFWQGFCGKVIGDCKGSGQQQAIATLISTGERTNRENYLRLRV